MIREIDTVALFRSTPEHGLARGDVGAVVQCYADAYEVEFIRADGTTQALLTLTERDVRLVQDDVVSVTLEVAK